MKKIKEIDIRVSEAMGLGNFLFELHQSQGGFAEEFVDKLIEGRNSNREEVLAAYEVYKQAHRVISRKSVDKKFAKQFSD